MNTSELEQDIVLIKYLLKNFGYEKISSIFNFLPENKHLIEHQHLLNQIISEKVKSGDLKQAEALNRLKNTIDDIFLLEGFLNDGDKLEDFLESKHHEELTKAESIDTELTKPKLKSSFVRNEKQNQEYVVKQKNKN